MTRIAAATGIPLRHQQHLVLHDISWAFYERLLREIGNGTTRVTYYRGTIEIMSPLPKHEKWKKRIGRLIETMSLELRIRMETLGSTTFRQKLKKAGLEPDECYYVQNAAAVKGKDRLDLAVDPPPDLAVECDITSRSIKREPVYAALGVPELWRFDGKRLQVLALVGDRYEPREASSVFPFLPMKEIQRFLDRMREPGADDLDVLTDFQQWVRTLKR